MNYFLHKSGRVYHALFFFSKIGHTITMKRATKNLVTASKLQTERDKIFSEKQDKMMAMIEEMQATILRLSCQADMRKSINIDDFFPIKQDSDLRRFLDKTDGQFNLRRDEFEAMLYLNVTRNVKSKRPFESYLLASVFSRDYISSHRWPNPRYTWFNFFRVFGCLNLYQYHCNVLWKKLYNI